MFFELSKILWFLLNPANVVFLLLVGGGVLLLFSGRARRVGGWLLGIGLVLTVIFSTIPFGTLMVAPLEARFPPPTSLPEKIDGIVVAGGVLSPKLSQAWGQAALNGNVDRVFLMARLAKRYPDAKLVFSGGSGKLTGPRLKEADFIADVLEELGIAKDRVLLENQSRNTHENAEFSKKLAAVGPNETWILVTSAFHMPRAVGTFRQAGWNVIAYATDHKYMPNAKARPFFKPFKGLGRFKSALHEWLGLFFYHLTGRSTAFFPSP